MSKKRATRMQGAYASEDRTVDGVALRTCRFCGEEKPIAAFPRNGWNPDSGEPLHRHDCKTCYNIRRRENKSKTRHSTFVSGMKRRGEDNVSYTHQQWKETVIYFGGECCYCGRTMRKGERLTRDHLVPVADGGLTVQSNIVPCCGLCNSSKGSTEWHEWYTKQSFFSQERMNKIFKWRSIVRAAGEE